MTRDLSASSAAHPDDEAIRQVVEARRLAWNDEDLHAYQALLAPDAELTSATGKTACGREDVLRLYVAQRQGPYRDATLTSTVVNSVSFVSEDMARVEATFELEGMRAPDGTILQPIRGTNVYVMNRQFGKWVISSMRGTPDSSVSTD